jgi:hypothetical protein
VEKNWKPYVAALLIVAYLVFLTWMAIKDADAKDDCLASGGHVVEAQHGEGWSCI